MIEADSKEFVCDFCLCRYCSGVCDDTHFGVSCAHYDHDMETKHSIGHSLHPCAWIH